jgi:hypothetical protein
MHAEDYLLQIHIHTVDGSSVRFVQNELDQVRWILSDFHPHRIFTREKIIIADRHSLTSFPVSRVVRLDLISEPLSHRILPSEIVNAVELEEPEFRALLRNPELRVQWDPAQPPDAAMVIFLVIEMAGQPPVFLVMEMAGEPLTDPMAAVSPLLAAPGLCFRMHGGGIATLNLAHLTRVTLYPGLQQPPVEAWPAQRVRCLQPNQPARDEDDQVLLPGILQAAT